ncbi:hypothetical protein ACFXJO_03220 [Streptomyces lavendulae]|uniref:hypothetical protein n=1 Tax=Streptomyces lavendulae TaxID=1914 RepID=UPI00367B5DFC
MLQLRRIRLENIGHRAAGFKSLVLDTTGGPSSLNGRPMLPVDVIMWLRNGGGKSSLLALLFSLLLPAKKDFIGAAKAKSLADYVPDGQVSHVIAEWADSARPASGAVLLTGGVYQWRDRQRPADVSGNWERLERRWYVMQPQPGGIELDTLPVRSQDGVLTLSAYVKALEAANKAERRLELSIVDEQYEWAEQLDNRGLDPQALKIQKAMNQEEGGITDLFKFGTAEEFIDFLIDMVVDTTTPTAARAALSNHADNLAARPARELEERFLAQALLLLRPVQKSTVEVTAAEQALDRQARLAQRAGEHVHAQAECRQGQAGTLRQEAEAAANEAREAERRAQEGLQHLAAVREAADRLHVEDCESELAARSQAALEAKQEAAAWDAVPVLRELTDHENEHRDLNELLARAQSEQAPLREAAEHAGAALYARLKLSFAQLAEEREQAAAEAEEAAVQVRESERQQAAELAAAGGETARAAAAEVRRKEEEAKLAQALRSGLLREQETPQEAVERLTQEQDRAQEMGEQARRRCEAERERAADISARHVACAGRLGSAKQEHDGVWEQWSALLEERRGLSVDSRLRELAGLVDTSAEMDLDEVGADLLGLLADQVMRADTELATERAQAFEDGRLRQALERDGFCPPPREVEQAVAALRSRGANAVSGMQFLRETVPAHQHDEVIAAIPHLIGGVVICGPVPGDDLAALARQADVVLPTVVSVAADVQARALMSKTVGDIAFLPLRRSVVDSEAGEEELVRVTARLSSLEERLSSIARQREADRVLIARLRTDGSAFGPRARLALEQRLQRLDEEVSTLTGQRSDLTRQAQEAEGARHTAERQLTRHTNELTRLAAAVPQALSLVEAARAVEHSVAEGQRARAKAREHHAAAQAFKECLDSAQSRKRSTSSALANCEDRASRWRGWAQEIQHELPAEVVEEASHAGAPEGSVQALRDRWVQARKDWRDGISDATLQQRLAATEATLARLRTTLAKAAVMVRARAVELAEDAASMDAGHLAARIAAADEAHEAARNAQAEARVLRGQATEQHARSSAALDDIPGLARLSFPDTQEARRELAKASGLLEEDRRLEQERRLNAEQIHRRADQAAADAARLQQSGQALQTTGERHTCAENSQAAPEMTIDALLLEQHGLSALTSSDLQPQAAEEIKDTLVLAVDMASRAVERSKVALRKDVGRVEQLTMRHEFVPVVDGRLRERLRHDLTAPARLTGLLEDIEERERQITALLAQYALDQTQVVNACTSTVEAVLDSIEEVARHSALPENLGSWSSQPFLSLELRQRARGEELDRRLSAEVDHLIASLPAGAAGRASALPDAMPLAKRLVLAALGGRGNILAKIIKPTQNLDTIERESVTEIKKFSGGELLTVSVLLYCTLARMRATQRARRTPGGGVGTLVLDNPFGKANYAPFVDLQRRVAAAHGIQLVYTTGSNDLPALGRFPLIIRMRNGLDPRTKRRYVQILERYGDAVAAGVSRTQDDGITSAHLRRSSFTHPMPAQGSKDHEQDAG